MSTQMVEAWGFGAVEILRAENEVDAVQPLLMALNAEAKNRRISPTKASDALDMSRDLIIDDAVVIVLGATHVWAIQDQTLRVRPAHVTVPSWPTDGWSQ